MPVMEHRHAPRRPVRLAVRYRHAGHDGLGELTDLSRDGAFLRTRQRLPLRQCIEVIPRDEASGAAATWSMFVVHRRADGVGLIFRRYPASAAPDPEAAVHSAVCDRRART